MPATTIVELEAAIEKHEDQMVATASSSRQKEDRNLASCCSRLVCTETSVCAPDAALKASAIRIACAPGTVPAWHALAGWCWAGRRGGRGRRRARWQLPTALAGHVRGRREDPATIVAPAGRELNLAVRPRNSPHWEACCREGLRHAIQVLPCLACVLHDRERSLSQCADLPEVIRLINDASTLAVLLPLMRLEGKQFLLRLAALIVARVDFCRICAPLRSYALRIAVMTGLWPEPMYLRLCMVVDSTAQTTLKRDDPAEHDALTTLHVLCVLRCITSVSPWQWNGKRDKEATQGHHSGACHWRICPRTF
mmetsp:Transcript_106746/g.297114  ORF Transcript_106746/g.297114 Transcript_106746/m.297114 type:complete len:310 (-) Transcript_106746:28-957(-)